MSKTVLILGDSTSMTVGNDPLTYPSLLANMKIWDKDTKIVNSSLPGFTTADACSFFFNNIKKFKNLGCVIIYLGNCDTMATEIVKGKSTPINNVFTSLKRKIYGLPKAKLHNKLMYYEWNDNLKTNIENEVTKEDFEYNISRIIKYCQKKNISTLLINPIANKQFPAGAGKGNYIFYHYYGLAENSSNLIKIPDKRFVKAFKLFEERNFTEAANVYKSILQNQGDLSNSTEFNYIVANNYAIAKAQNGNVDEAIYLLQMLSEDVISRREIMLYNLGMIKKAYNKKDHIKTLDLAFETDASMYRIREDYRATIKRIKERYPSIFYFDMHEHFGNNDFIDHCHLIPDSQKKLADLLAPFFKIKNIHVKTKCNILNMRTNPEYYNGNNESFNDYFKINLKLIKSDQQHLNKFIEQNDFEKNDDNKLIENFSTDIQQGFKILKKHPCFARLSDIIINIPLAQTGLGRFPELLIAEFMVSMIKEIENDKVLFDLIFENSSLIMSSRQYENILLKKYQGFKHNINKKNIVLLEKWHESILFNVKTQLQLHLKQKNQIGMRLKGTIFWYFRETLRFGSNSRISMRYDRLILEYCAEAIAVAILIDHKIGREADSVAKKLMSFLETIVITHEENCLAYNANEDNNLLLKQYDNALEKHLLKLKQI